MPKREKKAGAAPDAKLRKIALELPDSVAMTCRALAAETGIAESKLREWVREEAQRAASDAVEAKVQAIVWKRLNPLLSTKPTLIDAPSVPAEDLEG